jgi:hypothetical protein
MNPRPAYSLIFSFIMMTVIMVVATTTIQDTRNKIQLFGNLEATSQARLAAESAAELGIVALKSATYTDGTEVEEAFCTIDPNDSTLCKSEGNYTIYANSSLNTSDSSDSSYYVPIPNTGNAAPSEDCSILDGQQDKDHSCNWNKLMTGTSVTIPMYYDDGSGGITFPSTSDLTGWYLKLRTPCEDDSISATCDSGDRYAFPSDSITDQTTLNPLIAYWQIDYELSDGTVGSLFPDDKIYDAGSYVYRYSTNSEISQYIINNAADSNDYYVLEAESGDDHYDTSTQSTLTDLYLTLKIIGSLIDDDSASIPYLEWQLEWASSSAIVSPKATIVGEGYYQSGGDTYYHPFSISYSSIGDVTSLYTLSN